MKNDIKKLIQINDEIIRQIIYIIINKNCIITQKVINFSIIGNNKQQSDASESYPNNNEINNYEKNFCEANILCPEEFNKNKTVTESIPKSLINNRIKKINLKIFNYFFTTISIIIIVD